ncbi:MAG: HTH-type transcriptional repressor KstR2 [Pelotomaculum sp. PtaB.Bin104]|nr:MAG: HTH-type transcriptional repressor KstR2 [Pelotomaculum sp. PtaB.Bin104]
MERPLNILTTKEKIIRVVMDIIAEDGFQNITIRKIAAQAGVNVAAINYHFGSKDAVINEALKTVTSQLKSTFEDLKDSNVSGKTRLTAFINNYINIIIKYPDIIKNVIYHQISHRQLDEQVEYVTFLRTEGIELLKHTIGQIRPEADEKLLCLKTLHLISGISFPIIMGEQIKEINGLDLYDQETREMHIQVLLENVCRED